MNKDVHVLTECAQEIFSIERRGIRAAFNIPNRTSLTCRRNAHSFVAQHERAFFFFQNDRPSSLFRDNGPILIERVMQREPFHEQ
jgi:hypothetical protein